MKPESSIDYNALMGKFLAGEASPEEALQLDEWLDDPHNLEQFKQASRMWEVLPASARVQPPPSLQAWETLQGKLPLRKASPFFHSKVYWYVGGCIVTAVVFLLLSGRREAAVQVRPTEPTPAAKSISPRVITGIRELSPHTLEDDTVVRLSPQSTLTLDTSAGGTYTLHGEAFFTVPPQRQSSFSIRAGGVAIASEEGAFRIRAFAADSSVTAVVSSGLVVLSTENQKITVASGQSKTIDRRKQRFKAKSKLTIAKGKPPTASFSFEDVSFPQACAQLEARFGVRFKHADKRRFAACRISAEFQNRPLSHILNVLSATLNLSFQQKGKTITVSGKGCL